MGKFPSRRLGTERRWRDDVTGDGGEPSLLRVQEPVRQPRARRRRWERAAARVPGPPCGPPNSTYLLRSVPPALRLFQRPRAERQGQAQPEQREHGGAAAVAPGHGGTWRDARGTALGTALGSRLRTRAVPPPRPLAPPPRPTGPAPSRPARAPHHHRPRPTAHLPPAPRAPLPGPAPAPFGPAHSPLRP